MELSVSELMGIGSEGGVGTPGIDSRQLEISESGLALIFVE